MAFMKATAPLGLQNNEVLSADNAIPERHIVMATLRNAAPRLGLSASVLATLDAMLSCLAPKRNHHTVFASNATLAFRRNGISDRTIRRHAAHLQEAGLLERHDSPNRKRYTKHSKHAGKALRFGFDLSPLFVRLHEFAAIAADVMQEREHINFLRTKIRAVANARLRENPSEVHSLELLRLLRRKISLEDYRKILSRITDTNIEAEGSTDKADVETTHMTGNDGQNVRHHHKSNKEHIDRKKAKSHKSTQNTRSEPQITVTEIFNACPNAGQFSLRKIETSSDVVAHARTLAPMIGISDQSYESAHRKLGPLRTAATVWAIMQFHDQIGSVGAYFRSITTGSKSSGYSPERLIRRLGMAQKYAT